MSLSSDKLTWMLAGVGTLLAMYSTYWQLENFKQRAVFKPSSTTSVGVEQSTEDAIKLSTLSALARGVNLKLRDAALHILYERALKEEALSAILEKAESSDLCQNFFALRVLGLLTQNASPRRLIQPRVFKALLGILHRATTESGGKNMHAVGCQRETISLLGRLVPLSDDAQQYAIDAGLIDWLMESRDSDDDGVFAAVFEMGRDESIDDLLSVLRGRGAGRESLRDPGLLRNGGNSPLSSRTFDLGDHDDWVEVEVGDGRVPGAEAHPQPALAPAPETSREREPAAAAAVVPIGPGEVR